MLPLDLTDLNGMPEKVAEIEKIFGHIDILINNGGVSVRSDVLSTAMDVDIKVMLVNYFGAVALTKGIRLLYPLIRSSNISRISYFQRPFREC